MPTYSDAIADGDFTQPQINKPAPKLKNKPQRPKEFWEAEPGEAGTEGWRDDPDDPTAAQLGSIANQNPDPTPPRATDPTSVQPQQSPVQSQPPVTITPEVPAPDIKPPTARVDNPKWTEYLTFVDAVTSDESKIASQFISRVAQLQGSGCSIERLLTAAVGISAEGGEFLEIVRRLHSKANHMMKQIESILRLNLAMYYGMLHKHVWHLMYLLMMSLREIFKNYLLVILMVHLINISQRIDALMTSKYL